MAVSSNDAASQYTVVLSSSCVVFKKNTVQSMEVDMPLYGWILIGLGVVLLAFLKVKLGSAWLKKMQKKKEEKEKLANDDE